MNRKLVDGVKRVYRKVVPLSLRIRVDRTRGRCADRKLLRTINRYFVDHPDEKDSFQEELDYLNRLKTIDMIPYDLSLDIDIPSIKVYHNSAHDLMYIVHQGKALYFPQNATIDQVRFMYVCLIKEQHPMSPHRYLSDGFSIQPSDVFMDVGAAEGMISLELVETARSMILFESDPRWLKPLTATFEPWAEKVTIVPKTVSYYESHRFTSIDSFLNGNEASIFMKIDVEGDEAAVLRGAEHTLQHPKTRVVCCTYHCHGDSDHFHRFFHAKGFQTEFSRGYMIPTLKTMQSPPYFRKGVIRAWKESGVLSHE